MAKLKTNGHDTVKVGMKVKYRGEWGHGPIETVTIERIELCDCEGCKYGDEVNEVPVGDLNRCCVDLDNEHWAYGYQIEEILGFPAECEQKDYDERKAQLVSEMKRVLEQKESGFYFNEEVDGPRYFYPYAYGEKREEYLSEVYLTEEGHVAVTTIHKEGCYATPEECAFSDFSNEEMETIMRLCGIAVPE